MRTLTTYLDDGDTPSELVVSWTRNTDGGAFVALSDDDGTRVETLYAVPWRTLRAFALELLDVLDDVDADETTCVASVPCRAATLLGEHYCYEHGKELDS